ncbi:MAG: hypothetical protein K8U57_19265 [Planctomycetes bacterium]|nr:hypothetical protein [Planctomycetota bacterium]
MSRQLASQSLNRRNYHIAKILLACGLFVGVVFVGMMTTTAQDNPLDAKPPLPQNVDKQAKFQVPNKDGAIFQGRRDPKTGNIDGGIRDYTPLASEKDNSDEYQAWHIVVTHAKQFTVAELEENAPRELTRDDLLHATTPSRSPYRADFMRFDGKLTKIRWAKATRSLVEAGTAKIYEAMLIPFDEPPNALISVVFTELPAELAAVDQKLENEWMDVNTEVNAAGFFFKIRLDGTGPEQPAIPILIGRSVTIRKPTPASQAATAEDPIPVDKNLRVFKRIKDDAFIAKADQNWEELSSWNRILLHARRFTPAELEAAATDKKFADLFTDSRKDYKLDLVKFEGRLIMLNKMKPSEKLQAAGIETVYEGWLVPKDEPRGNPVCIVFTEPLESLEGVTGRVNKWVTFAGYSFKLMRYASGERDKDDLTKNVTKKAPLLLGRAVVERIDPDGPSAVTWKGFVPIATGAILALIGVALALSWWFRRGDKKTRQELETHRGKNPFGEAGPAVT